MAEKIRVPRAKIMAQDTQFVSYMDEGGTLRKTRASNVEVTEEGVNGFAPAAPAQESSTTTGPEGTAHAEATDPVPSTASPPSSDTAQPAPEAQPQKPPRSRKKTMATAQSAPAAKKKVASPKVKVAAKKAAPKPRTETTGVRTIGGKVVNLDNYEKVKAPGGGTSYHNGDPVAEKLAGKTLDEVYAIAAKTLKVEEKELRTRYKSLNAGMQRMSLGNRMRSVLLPKES